MRNPFKVLGLTPDIVRQLDETLLQEMVKRNYRLLSRVTHPDAGGSDKAFRELGEAYTQLMASPESLQLFREEYLKPRKDRLQELAGENDELAAKLVRVDEQLRQYVAATARRGGILLPGSLLMYDSLNVAISGAVSNRPGGFGERVKAKATFHLSQDEEGMTRIDLSFSGHQKSELSTNYCREGQAYVWVKTTQVGNSAHSYTPKGGSRSLGFVPIGTISARDDTEDCRSLKKALAITGAKEDFSRARDGYSWEAFQHLLPSLSTDVDLDRYLVGIKIDEEGLRFFLVGKIMAIGKGRRE